MKIAIASTLVALAVTFSSLGVAAGNHASHGAMQAKAVAENHLVEGLVKKVDKSAGQVTLAHGPLTNLGMPAMTMAFRVKDVVWLDRIKAGDRIRFKADQVNDAITVVHLEKMK